MLEKRNKADMAAIREKVHRYAATINAGDFEGWISIWTDDAIQMYPGAPARLGKEQIRAGMKPAFDNFTLKIELTSAIEVKVSSDLGYACGTYLLSMTPKAGGETIEFDGKYLSIFERQADGSWKGTHDCFNSNKPEN
jgi:uncharacterized protein (TIGR02246 family)